MSWARNATAAAAPLGVADGRAARPAARRQDPDAGARDWDAFVQGRPGDNLVQTTAWARTKRLLGFDTHTIVRRERGVIVGGAQLIVKPFGALGSIGYVARGPLLARPDPKLAAQLLDDIETHARSARVRHLIVQPPEGGELLDAELEARGYRIAATAPTSTATTRLDLELSQDQLLAAMSRSKRQEIRRSTVEVRLGDRDDVPVFHALHELSARRQQFTPLSLDFLLKQWDVLAPLGHLRLALAYADGAAIAGNWVSVYAGHVTARLAGWDSRQPRHHANVACDWWLANWARTHGHAWYDLGGIDRDGAAQVLAGGPVPAALRSTAFGYKRSLGGSLVLFPHARERTMSAIARPFVELLRMGLARSPTLRRFAHGVRNG